MRARLIDIPQMATLDGWSTAISNWWLDWPVRKRAFWSQLLLEPGQGWLRWGVVRDTRIVGWDPGEPEDYMHAPPLRRFAWWLRCWLAVPKLMVIGVQHEGERYRYSWTEAEPESLFVVMDDWGRNPDRKRELWQHR